VHTLGLLLARRSSLLGAVHKIRPQSGGKGFVQYRQAREGSKIRTSALFLVQKTSEFMECLQWQGERRLS